MIMHIVHVMGSITVVSLLYHILISIGITTAQQCNNTANFTTTQAQNRNITLSYLASNIVANGGFYLNATIGQDPNKVYAHAVCTGDSSPTACSNCVNFTGQDLISKCPVQSEAISRGVLDPPCIVRYANRSFFGVLELYSMEAGYNTGEISWDSGQFYEIWASLIDGVVTKASMGSSTLKYGTGEVNLTYFQTIYAQMQCTPDLSQSDCTTCLRQSVAYYETCCRGRQGGYVQRPNCRFRWDLYPFYETISDVPPPSPPTQHSPPPPIKYR